MEKYMRTTGDAKDGLYCYNFCLDTDPYKNVIHKIGAPDLLKGIQEVNNLSNIFFSDINVNAINSAIKSNIKKITGSSIDNQLNNSLFIIMRSI